jgi:two-component system, NarL family, response regulator NreC
MPLRLLLMADEQRMMREALRALLERQGFDVVGEAWVGLEATRMASELHPDITVLDFVMPIRTGLDAARFMAQASPSTRFVLLTSSTEEHYVLEALRAGIRGYVLKTQATPDLVHAIHEVSGGGLYLSPEVSEIVLQAWQEKTKLDRDPLTPRGQEVLRLVAEGKTTKEIACVLGLSVKTAESHRTRIMERLEIHDTAGLVRYAIRRGLIRP